MLIIFRCTVSHNFEPVRLVPGALFKYPTPGAWFESQHHQFFGRLALDAGGWGWGDVRRWFWPVLALVLACFAAGGWGVRLPLALDARGG